MYQTDKEKIDEVTKAVSKLYAKIDECIDCGSSFMTKASENLERDNYNTMDFLMSDTGELYELVEADLIEEVVELVQALYWARENVNSFPMRNYGERSDEAKGYLSALKTAVKNTPVIAETKRIKADAERLHKIVTDFGEWADKIVSNPLGTGE